jgi:hypothetical protein
VEEQVEQAAEATVEILTDQTPQVQLTQVEAEVEVAEVPENTSARMEVRAL